MELHKNLGVDLVPGLPMNMRLKEFVEQIDDFAVRGFEVNSFSEFYRTYTIESSDLEPYTLFSDHSYARNLIHRTNAYELILMVWRAGQSSPIHGHSGQLCWMRVIKGKFSLINYEESNDGKLTELSRSVGHEGCVEGPSHIHKVGNPFDSDALSLHLYARPLGTYKVYDMDQGKDTEETASYYSVDGKRC
ncbi:cysteine dioxygenase family protein [bacterium]|jgi:cysteine dioxygenase|nr:cysteine dioxygenase family protein [bacterium]MBT3903207.1 cysteine dioxygenase family protein [bacterium]MBT4577627.1 cysteine dioxygenase family protein [bacterium]MBT5345496.1 cysteine dioxygenase family protein [bacterium]MBT6131190.1 cysteine dioxygenase family protein [bacterium]